MHRFVPIYATWLGARVAEIPVNHYARQFGQSKYGISRTFKVVLDLITVKFMAKYFTKPIYVFGTAGLASWILSLLIFAWMVVLKYGYHTSFIETPLPVLVAVFFLMGMQLLVDGIAGRNYDAHLSRVARQAHLQSEEHTQRRCRTRIKIELEISNTH
jgi:hypothetical protein